MWPLATRRETSPFPRKAKPKRFTFVLFFFTAISHNPHFGAKRENNCLTTPRPCVADRNPFAGAVRNCLVWMILAYQRAETDSSEASNVCSFAIFAARTLAGNYGQARALRPSNDILLAGAAKSAHHCERAHTTASPLPIGSNMTQCPVQATRAYHQQTTPKGFIPNRPMRSRHYEAKRCTLSWNRAMLFAISKTLAEISFQHLARSFDYCLFGFTKKPS